MFVLTTAIALIAMGSLGTSTEVIVANQNKAPAGVTRAGVVRIALEAREGLWRPQADTGAGVVVQAFGEAGKALQIPGPLIRVRPPVAAPGPGQRMAFLSQYGEYQ